MLRMQEWVAFFARILAGLAFIGYGVGRIMLWDQQVAIFNRGPIGATVGMQLVPVVLVFYILIESIGGLFLLIGYKTRPAAFALSCSLACTLLWMRPFWEMPGPQMPAVYFSYLRDTMAFACSLGFVAFGAGRFSVDGD